MHLRELTHAQVTKASYELTHTSFKILFIIIDVAINKCYNNNKGQPREKIQSSEKAATITKANQVKRFSLLKQLSLVKRLQQ